jgi:type II secretory pathway pseudopilin PulG
MALAKQLNNQKGMSVIELLITVILIVIILTAVTVIINPIKRKAQSEDYRRFNDVRLIATSIKDYMYYNYGSIIVCGNLSRPIPQNSEWYCIGSGPCMESTQKACDISEDLVPNYLAAIPKDPTDNNLPSDSGYAIMRDKDSGMIFIGALYKSKYQTNPIEVNIVNLQ